MKDINGLEIEEGCVVKDSDGETIEVLKITNDSIVCWDLDHKDVFRLDIEKFLSYRLVILRYKELAHDKNGKMLCKYDRVSFDDSGIRWIVDSVFEQRHEDIIVLKCEDGGWEWEGASHVSFVSRPTDSSDDVSEIVVLELSERVADLEFTVSSIIKRLDKMNRVEV